MYYDSNQTISRICTRRGTRLSSSRERNFYQVLSRLVSEDTRDQMHEINDLSMKNPESGPNRY